MQGHVLASTNKSYPIKFTTFIKHIIALPNYETWVYFNNGEWQVWNVITNQMVDSGKLEVEICYPKYWKGTVIVYLSTVNAKVVLYDYKSKAVLPQLTGQWPTLTVLPENERTDQIKLQEIYTETDVFVMGEANGGKGLLTIMKGNPKPNQIAILS